jgi:hypothetical protein
MSIALVETAVRTRLLADTGTGGLRAASSPLIAADAQISNIYAGTVLTFPYVVFIIGDDEESDSFTADVTACAIEFHVFDQVSAGNVNCRNILERIRGDATKQSTRIPTFGFHRHNLALSGSEWLGGTVIRTGGSAEHERDVLHYVDRYTVRIQRNAP